MPSRFVSFRFHLSCLLCIFTALRADAQVKITPVKVATAVEREVATAQDFVGTVVPVRRSLVGAAVEGRVVEFKINEGDAVKKGQPLAQLRTETLDIQLAAAEAELNLRRAELEELFMGARPEEKEQAKARMASAKSRMDYTQSKYQRAQSLFQQSGAVSQEALDDSRAEAEQAEQSYHEAKSALAMTARGRKEHIAQAEARVVAQSQQVRLVKDQIDEHTIMAPFDGYVTVEHTEVGQWVEKGGPIAEVVQLQEVDVQVYVLAEQLIHLKLHTAVRIEADELPNELLTGQVVLVVPQADLRSRALPVKVRVKNRFSPGGPLLKAGVRVRVHLPTGKKRRAVMIPKDALVLGGPSPIIFVVDPTQSRQGTVRPVTVELGAAVDELIEVNGDLKPGDQVVVEGNERLESNQSVSIEKDS